MPSLCEISEFLKARRPLWGVLLVVSVIGWLLSEGCLLLDTACLTKPGQGSLLPTPDTSLLAAINITEDAAGRLSCLTLALLTVSAAFYWIVCPAREALLEGLVRGYWKNFLTVVLPSPELRANPLVLVKPTYGVLDDVKAYEDEFKAYLEDNGCNVEDYVIVTERGKRTLWKVSESNGESSSENKFLYLDIARNLTALKDFVDCESGGRIARRFCQPDTKYAILRDEYFEQLKKSTGDAFANRLIVVDGSNKTAVLEAINQNWKPAKDVSLGPKV